MEELQQSLQSIIEDTPQKLVLSKPTSQNPYKKLKFAKSKVVGSVPTTHKHRYFTKIFLNKSFFLTCAS